MSTKPTKAPAVSSRLRAPSAWWVIVVAAVAAWWVYTAHNAAWYRFAWAGAVADGAAPVAVSQDLGGPELVELTGTQLFGQFRPTAILAVMLAAAVLVAVTRIWVIGVVALMFGTGQASAALAQMEWQLTAGPGAENVTALGGAATFATASTWTTIALVAAVAWAAYVRHLDKMSARRAAIAAGKTPPPTATEMVRQVVQQRLLGGQPTPARPEKDKSKGKGDKSKK